MGIAKLPRASKFARTVKDSDAAMIFKWDGEGRVTLPLTHPKGMGGILNKYVRISKI